MGLKHELLQMIKFVYWRSIFSIFVLNMGPKDDSRKHGIFLEIQFIRAE